MKELFLRVLTLSLGCSAVLLPLLLLARRLRGRYAANTMYFLWLALALRMVVPTPLLPSVTPLTVEVPAYSIHLSVRPYEVAAPSAAPPEMLTAVAENSSNQEIQASVERNVLIQSPIRTVELAPLAAAVWLAGGAIFLLWQLAAYALARRRLLREARRVEEGSAAVYRVPGLRTPMAMGLLRPAVFLPEGGMEGEELALAHELCHIRRGDLWYKALFLLVNAVHWFNPLAWMLAREAGRNVELCCDDDVLRHAGHAERKRYGEALLHTAAVGCSPALSTRFGSGKSQLRERLINLFQQKKNSTALVCIVVAIVLLAGSMVACKSETRPQELPEEMIDAVGKSDPAPEETSTPQPGGEDLAEEVDRTDLEACVHQAVLDYGRNRKVMIENFMTASHVTLKTEERDGLTTVYAMALYLALGVTEEGMLRDGVGGHMPVAITFRKDSAGVYELEEYWIPQDGADYWPSIEEKFPGDLSRDDLDTQRYILSQIQSCYIQAVEHFKIDTDAVVEKLLDTVMSSPEKASGVAPYIDAHALEYRELTYYGSYALDYCRRQFEQGGQTGLKGALMAALCQDLLGREPDDLPNADGTGQGWYDGYVAHAGGIPKDRLPPSRQ